MLAINQAPLTAAAAAALPPLLPPPLLPLLPLLLLLLLLLLVVVVVVVLVVRTECCGTTRFLNYRVIVLSRTAGASTAHWSMRSCLLAARVVARSGPLAV